MLPFNTSSIILLAYVIIKSSINNYTEITLYMKVYDIKMQKPESCPLESFNLVGDETHR